MSRIKTPTGRTIRACSAATVITAALVAGAGVIAAAPAAAEVFACTNRAVSVTGAVSTESAAQAALRFTVSSTGSCAGSVTYTAVAAQTAGPQAVAGNDYLPTTGQISWPRGDLSTREVVVPLVNDLVAESDEVLAVVLSAPEGVTIRGASAVGTIVDDDELELEVGSSEPECWQQGGGWVCDQAILISRKAAFPVTVSYATADGSAIGGQDYVPVPGVTITFTPGVTSAKARVLISGGRPQAAGRYFYVTLAAPSAGAITVDRRSITIPLL